MKAHIRRLFKQLKTFLQKVPFSNLSTHASSIAFFFFISMIPLLILSFALFPFTGITEEQVTELLNMYIPSIAESIAAGMVHQAYSAGVTVYSLSILFMIWSSSQAMNALTHALNEINHTHGKHRYITRVLLNILDTLILVSLLVYLLFIHGIKNSLLSNMELILADIPFIHSLIQSANYAVMYITAVLILTLFYTVVPDGRRNYFHELPGAACAALGWIIFSVLFRIYINGVNIYNMFYGSLAAAAVFLFWLYCCFMIMLLGAWLNQSINRHYFL